MSFEQETGENITEKTDMYSLGVIFYEMGGSTSPLCKGKGIPPAEMWAEDFLASAANVVSACEIAE